MKQPDKLNRAGFVAFDVAAAAAIWAGKIRAGLQRRPHPLTGHFDEGETAYVQNPGPCAVGLGCYPEDLFHFSAMLWASHIDEVADNQAAQVTQAQLSCDFLGRIDIGFESGFLGF